VPDTTPDNPLDGIAQRFADHRAQQAALTASAQAWRPQKAADMDLGTFDSVAPLEAEQIGPTYARLAALSMQRLRVLSAQLTEQYRDHGMAALVRDKLLYNPATQEVEVAGEEPTALARMEAEERRELRTLLTTAVRLKLEVQSAAARTQHAQRMAALAQSMAELVGLDWANEETRRLAQRAVLQAEARVSGRA
jgi:hypothetical protein